MKKKEIVIKINLTPDQLWRYEKYCDKRKIKLQDLFIKSANSLVINDFIDYSDKNLATALRNAIVTMHNSTNRLNSILDNEEFSELLQKVDLLAQENLANN